MSRSGNHSAKRAARPSADDDPSLASVLGQGAALVQHGMDRVIGWGLRKMREADTETSRARTKAPDTAAGRAARAGRKLLGFLGRTGDAYFSKYEELKRRSPRA